MQPTRLITTLFPSLLLCFAAYADIPISADWEGGIGFANRYVWRGVELCDDFCAMPTFRAAFGNASLDISGAFDIADSAGAAPDTIRVEVEYLIPMTLCSIGVKGRSLFDAGSLNYPPHDTTELALLARFEFAKVPGAFLQTEVAGDVGRGNARRIDFSIGSSFVLIEDFVDLDFSCGAGLTDKEGASALYGGTSSLSNPAGNVWGTVSFPIMFGNGIEVIPAAEWHIVAGRESRDVLRASNHKTDNIAASIFCRIYL